MLTYAQNEKKRPDSEKPGRELSLVAGARYLLYRNSKNTSVSGLVVGPPIGSNLGLTTPEGIDTLTAAVARIRSGYGSGGKPTLVPDSERLGSKRLEYTSG